jgi:hypothetical protein
MASRQTEVIREGRRNMENRWPVLLYVAAALILLLFGIWIELPDWLIAVMVAIPLLPGVFSSWVAVGAASARSTSRRFPRDGYATKATLSSTSRPSKWRLLSVQPWP